MDINGVSFYEDAKDRRTPIFRWATENASVQRSLFIRGQPLDQFQITNAALALLGCATVETDELGLGGATRRWIHRQIPAAHPAAPTPDNPDALDYLYCASIPTGEPISKPLGVDADNLTSYEWYKFSTIFEALSHDVHEDEFMEAIEGPLKAVPATGGPARPDEGDRTRIAWSATRYVTRTIDPAARTISLRQGLVHYVVLEGFGDPAKPDAVNEGLGTSQARLVIRYTWHAVPVEGLPFPAIQNALQCVNNDDFDGWQKGTLYLADAKIRPYRSAFGQRLLDVQYHCVFLPNKDEKTNVYMGHNSILRVVKTATDPKPILRFWPISANGDLALSTDAPQTNAIFKYRSFPDLFRPTQG